MASFTTYVHVTGSARDMGDDKPFLQKIVQTVYTNHAVVYRDWIGPAASRKRQGVRDEDADWVSIMAENIDAIRRSDLVIIEGTRSRFSQGYQAYIASQYKKPTLIISRAQTNNRFISGVRGKYISIKNYQTEDELEKTVTQFIKKNAIPEKDLRFNLLLNRRIYKYLRDKSYESGENKSEIVRELIEKQITKRG